MPDPTPGLSLLPTPAPDAPKGPLSGTAALVVGTVGGLVAAASAFVPAPWSVPVAVLGFLGASLAGLAAAAPKVSEGKPVVQGVALTVATTVLTLLVQFYPSIPAGWPQSVALGVAALLAWLTGHAMPPLGATQVVARAELLGAEAAAKLATPAEAAEFLRKGPTP